MRLLILYALLMFVRDPFVPRVLKRVIGALLEYAMLPGAPLLQEGIRWVIGW